MKGSVVVMGVAGCGKSSLGAAVAATLGLPFVEGDAFHPPASRDRMRRGIALTDADRESWLVALAGVLERHPQGAVLACSALRRAYRERLRAASPGLRFLFLALDPGESRRRVATRGAAHFFPAALVESQFATLEPPVDEPGVLPLDGTRPLPELTAQALAWLVPRNG
jgi:gluconokinase